jgi:hypothetical protein
MCSRSCEIWWPESSTWEHVIFLFSPLGQWGPFGILFILILLIIPMLVFDQSQLVKTCNYIITSTESANLEIAGIRLLRGHLERPTSNVYTACEITNASCNSDPTPRFFTHSFGKTLFKRYLIINTIYTIIEIVQLILVCIFLNFRGELTNWASIESDILPYRVICILFSNNMGQENIDIYQCTLPLQYRIGRTFIALICCMIIIAFCNVICLIRSIYTYSSLNQRRTIWIPYYQAQSAIPFNITQARHFVDYIGCDGHYIFTILQKHMNNVSFQMFFELFVEITFKETQL